MNHVAPAPRLDCREDCLFVCLDANGDELRLRRDARGLYHPHRWRVIDDEWRGPVAFGLTHEEFRACAAALNRAAARA